MVGGIKKTYMLKQTCSWKLQVCLSVYGVLVPYPWRENGLKKEQRCVSKSKSNFFNEFQQLTPYDFKFLGPSL